MNKNNICEIFNSIQGEGRETGMPATFIRFNNCNKDCYFCDTDFRAKGHIEKSLLSNVIFTGGEPFLFKEDIVNFIKENKEKIFYGETNGSIFDKYLSKNIIWAISPKSVKDINIVKQLLDSNNKNYIKLVYNCSDFKEIFHELEEDYKERIYIQPQTLGNNFLDLQDCINFVVENNLKISSRLHLLWGLK